MTNPETLALNELRQRIERSALKQGIKVIFDEEQGRQRVRFFRAEAEQPFVSCWESSLERILGEAQYQLVNYVGGFTRALFIPEFSNQE